MLVTCLARTEVNVDSVIAATVVVGVGSCNKCSIIVIPYLSFMSQGVNPALSFSESETLMLKSQGAGLIILWSSIMESLLKK